MYDCAVMIYGGKIVAVFPKAVLSDHNGQPESRWFSVPDDAPDEIMIGNEKIPFVRIIVLTLPGGCKVTCILGDEAESVLAAQTAGALNMADVILCLAASTELAGKKTKRTEAVKVFSDICNAALVYTSAGSGESTTDAVYSCHHLVAQCGHILADESSYLLDDVMITSAVIDIEQTENEKIRSGKKTSGAVKVFCVGAEEE